MDILKFDGVIIRIFEKTGIYRKQCMVLRWLDHFYTQVFHPVELLINVLIIMAIKGYAQTTVNGTTIVILTKTNITVTTVINTALTRVAFLDLMLMKL